MYFEMSTGYSFDPSKLKDAHDWSSPKPVQPLDAARASVEANTFVPLSEMERYLLLGCPPLVMETKGDYPCAHQMNAAMLQRMRQSWELMEPKKPTGHWGD